MSGALQYVLPALQTIGGGAMSAFGIPGGAGMMTSGIGSLAGGGGQGTGGLSNFLSGIGNSLGMSGNPVGPGMNPTGFTPFNQLSGAQQQGVNAALNAGNGTMLNPTAGLAGNVAAVDPMTPDGITGPTTQSATPDANTLAMNAGLGDVGKSYIDYLANRRLMLLKQRTDYAPASSMPTSQMPQLGILPPAPIQSPTLG